MPDGVVAVVLVGVDMGALTCKAFDMRLERDLPSVARNTQAHLSALATDCADDGWTVVGEGAAPTPLVGASPGRISGVQVRLDFFSHSGTSRRSPFRCPSVALPIA